ncbi:MAG: PAS domain S-box protein, partial [Krumholzibacteria bacterium]|nr:PAS domain S-box protein [Candidatus Krumholzibacteria bacterium]
MPEDDLRDHQFLRELFDKAPLPYQSLDGQGRLLRVNAAWLDLLGYTEDEVLGRHVGEFLTPTSQLLLDDRFARFKNTGRVASADFELIRKDGSVVPVELNGTIATDASGGFLRTHCIFMDMSERLEAARLQRVMDQRLLHALKLESLEVMAGGIAHDFNNLLQTILGNADLALMGGPYGNELQTTLTAIDKAARQAAELCRQMLAYAGRGDYAMERLRLDELVLDLEALLRATISRKADLRFELSPDVPAVLADASQLRQVVVNLVTNAAEALREGRGTVTVSTTARRLGPDRAGLVFAAENVAPGDYVVLAVRDTGCGMSADQIDSIFDPFYSTKFTGRGLGLPMVRGVARAHGGAVAVRSEPG